MKGLIWYGYAGLATLAAVILVHLVDSLVAARRARTGRKTAPAAGQRRGWLARAGQGLSFAAFTLAAWPVVATMLAFVCWAGLFHRTPPTEPEFAVAKADLLGPLAIDEIERRERVIDPLEAVPDLPFGHLHGAWQAFLAQRQPAQAIHTFEAWRGPGHERSRRRGYVLVSGDGIGPWFTSSWRAPPLDPAQSGAHTPLSLARARVSA